MMETKIGEAILTADGKSVAAFWAVNLSMDSNFVHFIAQEDVPIAHLAGIDTKMVRCTIWHHLTAPDGRNYWRLSEGAPENLLDHRWFSDKQVQPGPEPKGMVRAIDVLLNENGPDNTTSHWLTYIRNYWQHQVEK
jgi:hypothetical protein